MHKEKLNFKTPEELCVFLDSKGIKYETFKHQAAITSKESAIYRNSPEEAGAKALIVSTKPEGHGMLVLSGNCKLDNKKAKKVMGVKSFRFLTADELAERTDGLKPGEVPPFGSRYGLTTFCDQNLLKNEFIYFNICSRTDSVKLKTSDYIELEQPQQSDFT